MMTRKKLFLFNFRQTLLDGLNKNVPSSVILSRLYGAHARRTWQYFPSGNLGTLLVSAALQLRQYIRLIRRCNAADD
jgi:hypothetical protein